jgi:predicted dehydrogenase
MKRIGLIGCGAVAGYGHLPAIKNVPDLELFAILDPDAGNLERARTQFGVPHAFTDAAEFFASGIDAVSITSPAPCHLQNVLDAARHRLPVLCEKPLAMDANEAARMMAAADKAGILLHTAFCYRYSASALKIRELVAARAIGDVRSLRLIYNWDCHGKFVVDAAGNRVIQARRAGRMIEGGPMVDCGTHQIDLAVFWLGSEVVRVCGHGAWADDYEAPDHVWAHLDHANGAHTMVEISYSYYHTALQKRHEFVYELIGTDGVIRYDREAGSFTLDNAAGRQDLPFHFEKDFTRLYVEWAASLHGRPAPLLASAATGQRVTDIARQATEQAMCGRKVGGRQHAGG